MKTRFFKMICLFTFMKSGISVLAGEKFVSDTNDGFIWINKGKALPILVDHLEYKGVLRAISNLQNDALAVTGAKPNIENELSGNRMLIIGSLENSNFIRQLIKNGKINKKEL